MEENQQQLAQTGKDSEKGNRKNGKRNFVLGVINGMLFRASVPFVDETVIIPQFIKSLTANDIFVGLAVGFRHSLWFFPQIFVANVVSGKEKKNPTYIFWTFVRSAGLLMMTLSAFMVGAEHPGLLLALFLVSWGITYLAAGMAGVSFMDVVAKTIPPRKLGSMWGYRFFFGGILAIAFGFMVTAILKADSIGFPYNYGIIFGCGFVVMTVAMISWSMASEDPDKITRPKKPLGELFRECVSIFREDARFRSLFLYMAVFYICLPGASFFKFHAKNYGVLTENDDGWLLIAKITGMIITNFIWARFVNDENGEGCRKTMIWSCIISAILPAAVLVTMLEPFRGAAWYLMLFYFFLVGSVFGAWFMGSKSALIRIAPEGNRPVYLGLMNTALGPLFLATGALAGTVAEIVGYEVMFGVTIAAALVALVFACRVRGV